VLPKTENLGLDNGTGFIDGRVDGVLPVRPVAAPSLSEPYKWISLHTALQRSFRSDIYETDRACALSLLMATLPRRERRVTAPRCNSAAGFVGSAIGTASPSSGV
jgi:hypothetical protein